MTRYEGSPDWTYSDMTLWIVGVLGVPLLLVGLLVWALD